MGIVLLLGAGVVGFWAYGSSRTLPGDPLTIPVWGMALALACLGTLAIVGADRLEAAGLVVSARELIQDGEFQVALLALNRAAELAPRYVRVYLTRSAAYAGIRQLDLAVEDANYAVNLQPSLPDARLVRARLYNHRGRYEEAVLDMRAALGANPDWIVGYFELAQIHVNLEDYGSSLAALRDMNVHAPSDSARYDALMLSGWVYEEKLDDLDAAIAAYTQAIPILPDRKIGYLRRAHAYRQRGDIFQAAEDLLRAAQRIPTPEDAGQYHWIRAACYWGRYSITGDMRDLKAAVSALEQSVRVDATDFADQSRLWLDALRGSGDESSDAHSGHDNQPFGSTPRLPPPPVIFPN